ncbi:S41 family peptidase [Portibacter lacus]|uniref:S41 family peptidase n=1 Tax=Portibacter lacus TaxID=1099794 RepID=UPI001F271FBD|nr:S41 family peptidase [Portibacter lacus]
MSKSPDEQKESYKIWIPLLFSVVALIGLIGGYKMAGNDALSGLIVKTDHETNGNTGRVEELVRFIESRYVSDLDSDELIEDAFRNVLDHLDPHSIYLKPEDMKQLNDQMGGSFEGIGIESILINDTLYINHVILDGPAYKAGLKPGDQIISINDSIIAGETLTFNEIREKLKGDTGDQMKLSVVHFSDGEQSDISLNIGKVDVKSVEGFKLNSEFAVVKIQRFSSDSYKEFMDCLSDLERNGGFKSLILDLRGNPGGFLPEATKMLNQIFKEKGKLLVYTQGRNERVSEYKSTGKNFFNIDKIAVLVDEGSASGSEIMAGAIQDWDRGLIVGRRTFGKGLVQEQYDLSNGGALRLTVAEYFTPSGRLIQRSYENKKEYKDDIAQRIESGELLGEQDSPIMDSTEYKTKIKKRVVYGGGGISPDIYIPTDSLHLSIEYITAISKRAEYVFKKFLNNDLTIPSDTLSFINEWLPSPELVAGFEEFLERDGRDYSEVSPYLESILKVEVAKLYFGNIVALEAELANDDFVMQSVLALSKQNIFAELQ